MAGGGVPVRSVLSKVGNAPGTSPWAIVSGRHKFDPRDGKDFDVSCDLRACRRRPTLSPARGNNEGNRCGIRSFAFVISDGQRSNPMRTTARFDLAVERSDPNE